MDAQKFGVFVATIRKEKNMTQAELASKIKVTDKAVSRWERGLGFPDINSLEPLADALGISVLELMKSEKIQTQEIQCKDADIVLSDTIKEADKQRLLERKQERKTLIITIGVIALFSVCILLIDSIGWSIQNVLFTGIGVLLPLMSITVFTVLAIIGIIRRTMGKTCKQVFIAALFFVSAVIMMFLVFFVFGVFAFPEQL